MLLVKFIAENSDLSRRNSERAIKYSEVTVNGKIIQDPAFEVTEADFVILNKKRILKKEKYYVVLNKPEGFITSKKDPSGRPTIIDIFPPKLGKLLDPVGRLDFNSSGALLLTNDGDLGYELSHPKFIVKKVYVVITSRNLDEDLVDRLRRGVKLDDGFVKADRIIWKDTSPKRMTIELHSGKYRVIRRMFEIFKIFIKKLHRLSFANISVRGLKPGEWRHLDEDEIKKLKKFSNE